jgi:hypothetical protein
MILIMIIALVIVITQSASTNNIVNGPRVYHHTQPQTHSYFINDRKVSKQNLITHSKPILINEDF